MKKIGIILLALCVVALIAIFAILASARQRGNCESIADTAARDDCWHDRAHATNDRSICSKITVAQEKEHCLGHVAE